MFTNNDVASKESLFNQIMSLPLLSVPYPDTIKPVTHLVIDVGSAIEEGVFEGMRVAEQLNALSSQLFKLGYEVKLQEYKDGDFWLLTNISILELSQYVVSSEKLCELLKDQVDEVYIYMDLINENE